MSDQNPNGKTNMGNCLPVSRNAGNSSQQGDIELPQIHSEAMATPVIQHPADDTMPVKAWVFGEQPAALNRYKPLRPEDERKALEAINRHLPPWDQIEIPQQSRNHRERLEAVKPHGSSKAASPSKTFGKKKARRVRSKNWIQTEEKEEENALTQKTEDDLSGPVVLDLIVTRADGEMRRLRDPNVYVDGE